MENSYTHHPSSYRDPSGFIFTKDNILYRQVNKRYAPDFDQFINSGCYDKLVREHLLIRFETVNENLTGSPEWHTTLKPERIPFISYPYEWSFDMLKDAALLTLRLVKETMAFGLMLKDATPGNIQWHRGRMVFIDTLSFERYNETEAWIAYRQFCEQFLGPLLLMHYNKMPLQQLFLAWPEGVPLHVTSSLLPYRSRFSLYTYLHIHLHAKISNRDKQDRDKKVKFSRQKLLNLINSLESLVNKCKLPPQKSAWSAYYDEANERGDYLEEKKKIVSEWVSSLEGITTAADLGANDGVFAKLLADRHIETIAADQDPYCINNLYLSVRESGLRNVQPLVADLANPSPATGVNNRERASCIDRVRTDLVLALALVHHLAIGRNIPFELTVQFFNSIRPRYLIIEFVPKNDVKVQQMLKGRKDIFDRYTENEFTVSFQSCFRIQRRQPISDSGRVLYLMTHDES